MNSILPVIGVTDVGRGIAFWTAALGLRDDPEWASEDWRTLYYADGSGRALGLMRSASPAEPRPRVHLDILTSDTDEQRSKIDQLLTLGAKRVAWDLYPPAPDFVVLADPDDNIFCVVDLSIAPSGTAGPD